MELRHLRYFVAIAEEGSFLGAARRLNVSQPPLSTQIRDLEVELGAALLQRSWRGASLTPAGEVFYVHACAVLAAADLACRAARSVAASSATQEDAVVADAVIADSVLTDAVLADGLCPAKAARTAHPQSAVAGRDGPQPVAAQA